MKLILGQNRFLKKNSFVGKFLYRGAEISAHQKNLEISKLRSKLRTASQSNIFSLSLPKFDNFEKKIFSRLYKKEHKRLYKRKKETFYPFFEGPSYAPYMAYSS